MEEYLQARVNQPKELSAGSIFKNPPRQSAGDLIDQVGLKGEGVGEARCQDVLELLSLAKSRVRAKFGIELEEEIQIIDEV